MALAGKSIHLYRRLRLALHSLYVLASITDSSRRRTRWMVRISRDFSASRCRERIPRQQRPFAHSFPGLDLKVDVCCY
jgi:hypothetical protein